MSAFRPVQQQELNSMAISFGSDDSDNGGTEMETLGYHRFGASTPQEITPTVIPQVVREKTPDSVVSTGNIRIQGAHGTLRDINIANISVPGDFHPDRGHPNTRHVSSNKKSFLFWKYSIGCVVSLAVLTAIVSAIYFYKSTEAPRAKGTMINIEMKGFVCPDVKLSLGEKLRFDCIYQGNRLNLTNATIMDGNSVLVIGNASVNETVKPIVISVMTDLNVSCSINGLHTIAFSNNGKTNVSFVLNSGFMKTTLVQRKRSERNCNETEFDAVCSIQNECSKYNVSFVGRRTNGFDYLDKFVSCEGNFSYELGSTETCSAVLDENTVSKYFYIGCQAVAANLEKEFKLPLCGVNTTACFPDGYFRKFNCSKNSNDIIYLNNGTCNFEKLNTCFLSGRKAYSYDMYRNGTMCWKDIEVNTTVSVCRLNWCRSRLGYLYKNDSPGVQLCGNTYTEMTFPDR